MTKIIIIYKKHIKIILIVFILFISIFSISTYSHNKNIFTFSSNSKYYSNNNYDLNGDGIKDELSIYKLNNFYEIKVTSNNSEYLLNCIDNNFLSVCPNYNLKINIIDLSRDNIPEIILSNSIDNTAKQLIIKWTGEKFETIESLNNNILGIINSKNTQTPMIFSASVPNYKNSLLFLIDNNSICSLNSLNYTINSLSETEKFVDLIEYPYEILEVPDIFSSDISYDELKLLWNLNKEIYQYTFQSGYFYDIDWNNYGSPNSILWTISFKKNKISNSKDEGNEFVLYIEVSLDQYNNYRISSIKK